MTYLLEFTRIIICVRDGLSQVPIYVASMEDWFVVSAMETVYALSIGRNSNKGEAACMHQ